MALTPRPSALKPAEKPSSKHSVSEKRPRTLEERRIEWEHAWSSRINQMSEHDFKARNKLFTPELKVAARQEIQAVIQPELIEKKYLGKYFTHELDVIMHDPKLSFERLFDHIHILEERYNFSKNSERETSGNFMALMYLVPMMKKAIFQGTLSAFYAQQLRAAGISFKPEWMRDFVKSTVGELPRDEKIAQAFHQLTSTGRLRVVGEAAIRKSIENKDHARHALLPVVSRAVFARRTNVKQELQKIRNRLAFLGMNASEQRPFLLQFRKALLRNQSVDSVMTAAREQAVENMMNHLNVIGLNSRTLFQQAGINAESAEGLRRLAKIASLLDKVKSRSKRVSTIRRQLQVWKPKSVGTPRAKQPLHPTSARKSSIGIRRTLSERGTISTPAERLSVMNSRLRENKISNKQRIQLIERMMLTTIRIPEYNKGGIIDITTLAINAARKSYPDLFSKALQNLIRKNKLMQVSNTQYRLAK